MGEEEIAARKRDDIRWVMSTEQGRRFVWDLLGVCGVYRSLEGDANSMMVQEGSRRIGLHLLGVTTDADEDSSFKMMLEAKNRILEEDADDNRTNDDGTDDDTFTVSDDSGADYDNTIGGYDSGEYSITGNFDPGSFF